MATKKLQANLNLSMRYPSPESQDSLASSWLKNTPLAQANSSHDAKGQVPELPDAIAPVTLRYEKYQDRIHVNSVEGEGDEEAQPLTGAKHFLHMLDRNGFSSRPPLDHINYTALSQPTSQSPAHCPFDIDMTPPLFPHPRAPKPPSQRTAYSAPIYAGKTHNPAVFLAILCIAQHNLPSLNFVSAHNHIPNIAPTDKLPTLFPAAPGNLAAQKFLDTKSPPVKRGEDEEVNVVFLPDFYDNGFRHAVGFFTIYKCPQKGRILGTAFFTPCTEAELRRFGLVSYVDETDGFGEGGVDTMSRVACEEGEWLERDTVEDYEEWKLMYKIAGTTWEARMELMRGGREG